jgi:Collagen triple helix repeat (20 copies)
MRRLRGKLTYSNVMVTVLAVLVVGGGTAYAASELLPKNSVGTAQIKKEAVTPAKLSKASKAALTGPKGATGATGSQGAKGDQGQKGDQGPKGDPGESALVPLPSGASESGFYAAGSGGGEEGYIAQGITFRQPLAEKIPAGNAEWLQAGETSAFCPAVGTAAPNHLCLYDNEESGVNLCCIYDNEFNEPAADKNGFIVYWEPFEAGSYVSGEYTVTAP